jgi:general secretion pathway protein L
MLIFNSSLGIDFRRNHLILTLLKKSFGKIRLEDYRIYPLWSEGQKEVREAQWISLITTFLSKHQINKERVSIAIPREKVIVRFLRLPIATKENLRKVLEYEAPKYTPFDKEEIFFDYQILNEDKEWVHLIAVFMKKDELSPYLSLLKKIGLQPLSIQIPSIGALNLFFYHQGDKENEISVLLDVNEPFFEMNLIQGRDWKESFHLPLPAERKEERIINTFNRSGLDEKSLSRATFFIYGLDAAEKTLPAFEQTDSLKEVFHPPMDRIEMGKDELRPDYIYASIGLPLKGITKTRLDLNLLPLEMRKKSREIGKPLFMILTLLALILICTWGMGIYSGYRNALDTLRSEVKKRKPEIETIEKVQKQRGELAKEISEYEKITRGEVSKIEILKELTEILPSSVWVWNVKYSGAEIELSGFADSASELIPLLDKSPLFEKVEFLAPVTKERDRRIGGEKERERFKIKMRLEGRRAGS